jgi:hypothetical protein
LPSSAPSRFGKEVRFVKRRLSIMLAVVFVGVSMLAPAAPVQAAVNCHKVDNPAHRHKCNVRNTFFPLRH